MKYAIGHYLASVFFLLLLPFSALTDNTTAGSIFVYNTSASSNTFTFALNAVKNGDLYMHMSGPSANAWMAVGIGEEMADSLMFVVYRSQNGNTLLSPRVAFNGESEPTYYLHVDCDMIDADDNGSGKIIQVNAVCHNATSWKGGSLDLTSKSQPWMFAFGPRGTVLSDSMDAGMNRHDFYGNFDMDMTVATSQDVSQRAQRYTYQQRHFTGQRHDHRQRQTPVNPRRGDVHRLHRRLSSRLPHPPTGPKGHAARLVSGSRSRAGHWRLWRRRCYLGAVQSIQGIQCRAPGPWNLDSSRHDCSVGARMDESCRFQTHAAEELVWERPSLLGACRDRCWSGDWRVGL